MKTKNIDNILTVVSILILIIIIETTLITSFEPDSFYYLKELPFYYYVGLAIIIYVVAKNSFNEEKKSKFLNIIAFSSLCFYVNSIKYLVIPGYLHFDIYGISSVINSIISHGHLSNSNITIYNNEFPIAIIFFSIMKMLCNFSYENLALYYPISINLMLPFFIYVTSSTISKLVWIDYKKYVFIPSVLVSISPIGILAPLSYALILYILYIYIYIKCIDFYSIPFKIILILTGFVIIMANPTTSYIMLIGMSIFPFIAIGRPKRKLYTFYFLFLSILLSQTIYRSTTTTRTIATTIQKFVLADITATTERIIIQAPDFYFLLCYKLYILKIILIVLLSLITAAIMLSQMIKKENRNMIIELFLTSSLLSFVLLFFICFIALSAFIERPLPFIVFFLCLSLPFLLNRLENYRKYYSKILYSLIILLILLHVSTAGWYAPYNSVTTSEITGRNFLVLHPELEIKNTWSMQDVYIKRLTNYEILRGEKIKGYLVNTEQKNLLYNNGNFMTYK